LQNASLDISRRPPIDRPLLLRFQEALIILSIGYRLASSEIFFESRSQRLLKFQVIYTWSSVENCAILCCKLHGFVSPKNKVNLIDFKPLVPPRTDCVCLRVCGSDCVRQRNLRLSSKRISR